MNQITGALVGIALVLSAVFVPMAFFGGSTGVIYRQFSITIVSAMILSVLVAIIFTPALCATFLKPVEKGHQKKKRGFFGWFNRIFDAGNREYTSGVGYIIRHGGRHFVIYLAIVGVMGFLFTRLPRSFLPAEDQGILFAQVTTPPGTPQKYTQDVGHVKLMEARDQLLKMANQNPNLAAVRSNGLNDEPQYKIEIDREKANALSLTVSDVNTTLAAAWGSEFIDQFTDRGRVKKVFIQGSDNSRMVPEDFNDWFMVVFKMGRWQGGPSRTGGRRAHI